MEVRTRMAPSPTGEYHIGGMRTLLYNYAFAKKEKGKFILRIEDTDQERLVEGASQRLIDVIKEYGLSWDEGPYIQSERLDLYSKYIKELVNKGSAYYCFCTKERLEELRAEQRAQKLPSTKYDKHCLNLKESEVEEKLKNNEPHVIRLNIPKDEIVSFKDLVLGEVSFPTNDIDDQILIKSDGFPTYHFAVVVDDHLMKINYVMRGMEWLPSTPKHVLLYKAFGWKIPNFAHLPLLKEVDDNKKMSKRMGSVSAEGFLSEGYLPEALLNFLMFLGWNPGTEKEIYTLEEFIQDFSLEKVQTTDLVAFDRKKLLWMNGMYIRSMPVENLWEKLKEWSKRFNVELKYEEREILKVLGLIQERMKVLSEFNELTHYFFEKPDIDKNLLKSFAGDKTKEIISKFIELYESIDENSWTAENLDKISHEFIKEENYSPKEAFMTIRVAVSGEKSTPPLFDVLNTLGKEVVLKRLRSLE